MKIEFLSGFEKDLSHIRDKMLANIILECIDLFEKANTINDIPNIKKLKGHSAAFHYRKGKYRIGFYMKSETVVFAAFDTRAKIYHRFPLKSHIPGNLFIVTFPDGNTSTDSEITSAVPIRNGD